MHHEHSYPTSVLHLSTMNLNLPTIIVLAAALQSPILAGSSPGFAGDWQTTYGVMNLTEPVPGHITGAYQTGDVRGRLRGTVQSTKQNRQKLIFTFEEPSATGSGEFTLSPGANSFTGRWTEDGRENQVLTWEGARIIPDFQGFTGLWSTTFGPMRLHQSGDAISGSYSDQGTHCELTRTLNRANNRLAFTYREPETRGQGHFQLSAGQHTIRGQWKAAGDKEWQTWTGTRILPEPGLTWLVVLEAPWESGFARHQPQYALGDMLEAFFARAPQVRVRQRPFTNREALLRWGREIAYLAEPAVVVVACHGTAKGLTVQGQFIEPETIAKAFQFAGDNLRLLHFSSCSILKGQVPQIIQERIPGRARFPISGYASQVDWPASVSIDFAYLDMILSQDAEPEDAARRVLKLMPFAGERPVAGTDVKPARFRFQPGSFE